MGFIFASSKMVCLQKEVQKSEDLLDEVGGLPIGTTRGNETLITMLAMAPSPPKYQQ